MIRLIPGAISQKGTAPEKVFFTGRTLLIKVLNIRNGKAQISAAGRMFNIISNTPLRKGEQLIVKVIRDNSGIQLKVLQDLSLSGATADSRLNQLLGSDPQLIRALMKTGLSLTDVRINRLKRINKLNSDDLTDEDARYLAIMEEKGIAGIFYSGSKPGKEKNGEPEGRQSDSWKDLMNESVSLRSSLIRDSEEPGKIALFNHKRSNKEYNWVILPVRMKIGVDVYSGSFRLCIHLETKKIFEGILSLENENSAIRDEWIFGLTDTIEKKLYLLKAPVVDGKKLHDFIEKVRKQGFVFVDTNNRGIGDGFSPVPLSGYNGVNTEV